MPLLLNIRDWRSSDRALAYLPFMMEATRGAVAMLLRCKSQAVFSDDGKHFFPAGGMFFDEDGNRQYTNGVCITYYINNGTPILGTESWTDGRIYGVCGMTGGFSVYDE